MATRRKSRVIRRKGKGNSNKRKVLSHEEVKKEARRLRELMFRDTINTGKLISVVNEPNKEEKNFRELLKNINTGKLISVVNEPSKEEKEFRELLKNIDTIDITDEDKAFIKKLKNGGKRRRRTRRKRRN